jgi:hypothetical protein
MPVPCDAGECSTANTHRDRERLSADEQLTNARSYCYQVLSYVEAKRRAVPVEGSTDWCKHNIANLDINRSTSPLLVNNHKVMLDGQAGNLIAQVAQSNAAKRLGARGCKLS